MIKRELKVNFKSFLLWTTILIILFLMVYLVYPYIVSSDAIKDLDEMMKMYPKELIKAFNIDLASINTAYGWLKSEGFLFVLLIIGFYSSLMGSQIVLKEENDKTIEYLISLPIERKQIMTSKILVSIMYIFLMVLILGIFNYIGLTLSGDFNHKEFFLISCTPLLIAYPLFSLNLLIGTLLHKTKKTVGISLGFVFFFYIINVLSEISKEVEGLKYLSIYTLANIRNVITNKNINPICILISILLTILFTSISYIVYNKKELI